jgi:hypothetical protein
MGLREAVARSTLADANELRDWHMWADIAAVLVRRARKLYVSDDIGLDLANTVYALDSTTIDLCLSLFPWADFRSTKAAVKIHTLLDLRGPIPSFIHISDGKMGDAAALVAGCEDPRIDGVRRNGDEISTAVGSMLFAGKEKRGGMGEPVLRSLEFHPCGGLRVVKRYTSGRSAEYCQN